MATKVEPARTASAPTTGALRDAVRTFVGFVVAFLAVKLFGEAGSEHVIGATEGLVVIITSAIFAFVGKAMRNKGLSFGKIV